MQQFEDISSTKIQHQRYAKRFWNEEEDLLLTTVVENIGTRWLKVSKLIPGRSPSQCLQRWKRIKPAKDQKRIKWTTQDDQIVYDLVKKIGNKWEEIGQIFTPNRTGRQIRERFINQIHPGIDKRPWTLQEDIFIWNEYQKIGNKWTKIANQMEGRTGHMVKNRFNLHIRLSYGKQQNPYNVLQCEKKYFEFEMQSSVNLQISTQAIDQEEAIDNFFQLDELNKMNTEVESELLNF